MASARASSCAELSAVALLSVAVPRTTATVEAATSATALPTSSTVRRRPRRRRRTSRSCCAELGGTVRVAPGDAGVEELPLGRRQRQLALGDGGDELVETGAPEQVVGRLVRGAPLVGGGGQPQPPADIVAGVGDPRAEARPLPEQRLVGDLHRRTAGDRVAIEGPGAGAGRTCRGPSEHRGSPSAVSSRRSTRRRVTSSPSPTLTSRSSTCRVVAWAGSSRRRYTTSARRASAPTAPPRSW